MFVYDLHAVLVPSAIDMDIGAKSINQIAKGVPGARIKLLSFSQFYTIGAAPSESSVVTQIQTTPL